MPRTQEQIREQARIRTARYRERHKDTPPTEEQRRAHNERNRRYREHYPETVHRIATESNEKRREAKAEWAKKRWQSLPIERRDLLNERSKVAMRNWAANNRETSRQRAHDYYWSNRSDPTYRLVSNLRARLWCALNKKRLTKSTRTFCLVGCSVAFLREHLERQFKVGMSWENYGEWHVDHIKPCASFDLSNPEQLHACFHYSNLQPLWAQENQIKSCKLTTKEPRSVNAIQ